MPKKPSPDSPPRVIITGATGFIGSHLARHFAARGWQVAALARTPPDAALGNITWHRFDLGGDVPEAPFRQAQAIIHCAYVKFSAAQKEADAINLAGTQRLLALSRQHDVKFVFLSTMSAHAGALSHYGKNKLELEKRFDPARDLVLKPGLVLGRGGLFEAISGFIQKSKALPLIGGGTQPIHTIAIGQLTAAIEMGLAKDLSGVFLLGEKKAVTLRDLNRAIAQKHGRSPLFVPVPFFVVDWALSAIALLRIPLNISKETLLGLKQLKAFHPDRDRFFPGLEPQDHQTTIERL